MPLTSNHLVEEINGIRCTVVEKGIPAKRMAFLKDLLEFNRYEVEVAEVPKTSDDAPLLYNLGVTDLVFNPTIAVYEMCLKTKDGKSVSPAYWEQQTDQIIDQYWEDIPR